MSIFVKGTPIMMPTRECLFCEKLENPQADIINQSAAWLCPECKRKIKQIIEREES